MIKHSSQGGTPARRALSTKMFLLSTLSNDCGYKSYKVLLAGKDGEKESQQPRNVLSTKRPAPGSHSGTSIFRVSNVTSEMSQHSSDA